MDKGQHKGGKDAGAMLGIGEVADRIGVAAHVLRYWETRFPELKPLQRSGKRRYYRAEDVALVERIHDLLHRRGYTVEGARKALLSDDADAESAVPIGDGDQSVPAAALAALRDRLVRALNA
jgi:DNA-binding transcriptional MerR regulator